MTQFSLGQRRPLRRPKASSNYPCPAPACPGTMDVIDSRPSPQGIRRRRRCTTCDHRLTTFEVTAALLIEMPTVAQLELLLRQAGGLRENIRSLLSRLPTERPCE